MTTKELEQLENKYRSYDRTKGKEYNDLNNTIQFLLNELRKYIKEPTPKAEITVEQIKTMAALIKEASSGNNNADALLRAVCQQCGINCI